jgi:hypothetical protein
MLPQMRFSSRWQSWSTLITPSLALLRSAREPAGMANLPGTTAQHRRRVSRSTLVSRMRYHALILRDCEKYTIKITGWGWGSHSDTRRRAKIDIPEKACGQSEMSDGDGEAKAPTRPSGSRGRPSAGTHGRSLALRWRHSASCEANSCRPIQLDTSQEHDESDALAIGLTPRAARSKMMRYAGASTH